MSEIRATILAWLGLLVLLALTVGSSFIELGPVNPVLNLVIAGAKSLVILLVFMRLWASRSPTWLVSVAVGLWLTILFALTLIDYVSR